MERKKCFVLMLAGLGAYLVDGIRLPACGSGGIEVSETARDVIVTCDQFGAGDTVSWQIVDHSGVQSALGLCSPNNCAPIFPNLYGLSRPSPTVSQLTIKTPARALAKYNISCSTTGPAARCGLNVIYPAEVSNCSVQLQKISNTWTVTGSCDVTKVFASSGTYICQWFRGDSQSQTVSVTTTTYSPVPHSESGYWKGTCSFSSTDVVSTSGSFYHYRVVVSPGDTPNVFGPVSVESPINTSVTCNPRPYVPENTNVTCTCSTQSVGQPAGRLMWFRGNDNNPINTGNYGDTSLTMTPQTMTRSQGDVQFRCDVDWATRVTGQHYTAMVSYGPDNVIIPENRTFYTDSAGSHDLTLTCHANDVRPTTGFIYTWTGRCPDVTSSMCTFRPRPPGSDNGSDLNTQVVCTVRNPYNNNFTKQGSLQLNLKYPPSSSPTISGYSQGQVLHQGDSLKLTCTVTGGDPLVSSVNLTCPGHHENGTTSGQSSSLTIPSLSATDHGIECRCSGQWVRPDYYILTDTRTLIVYYTPQQTTLTVNNNAGNLTVREGNTVVLACRADGRPTPNMRLVKKETGQEVHSVAGGDLVVDDRDSWLNYTLTTVSCSDTGNYTCTARNDAGTGPADSGYLFVLCPPRFPGPKPVDIPSVNYRNQSVQLTFNLWAFPAPVSHHIMFLGSTLNFTEPETNVTGIVFNVTLRTTVELYNYTYDVTILKVTDASAAGYYRLTANNTLGEAGMVFQVRYNEEQNEPSADSSSFTGAAVGIAIAGVVAACGAAAIFVFYRKRKAVKKDGASSQTKARQHHRTEDKDVIINTLYGHPGDTGGEDSMMVSTVNKSSGNADFGHPKGEYEEISVSHDNSVATSPSIESGAHVKLTTATQQNLVAAGEPGDENYASRQVPTSTSKLEARTKPTASSVPSVKPKATKKETSPIIKKGKRNPKKGDKKSLGDGHDSPKDINTYGNMLLTMNPMEGTVYENTGFPGDEANFVTNGVDEGTAPDVNKDGLVYTTIQFTDSQRSKAQQQPSSREATEYVSIDFTKKGPIVPD